MKKVLFAIAFTVLFAGVDASAATREKGFSFYAGDEFSSDAIIGQWTNEEGAVRVKIEKFGSRYFGKIVWLEKPNEADGKPKLDKHNPDPELRDVPFIGLRIVKDLQYKGNGVWGGGSLYDAEHGKSYGCKITLEDADTALIRGYIGLSFIGKSVKFLRTK